MTIMDKASLIAELVAAIKVHQDAVERFDSAAATKLVVNGTDLRCLAILDNYGPFSASAMADALGLTRGATTTALDRLARAGYIERGPSGSDGRSVVVDLTAEGRSKVREIWKPVRMFGREHLEGYSERELRVLIRFFERSTNVQQRSLSELLG